MSIKPESNTVTDAMVSMKGMHINYKHWSTKKLKRDKEPSVVSIDITNIAGLNNAFRNSARRKINKVKIFIYGDPGLTS